MKLKSIALAAGLAVSALATGAIAQDYPSRSITMIVPYGPGGGVGINARALAPHLGAALGQEVVVEHREGGGGVTGHTMGATAAPDGYTITMVSPGIAAAPLVIEGVAFTPEDYAYIGQVTFVPQFIVVSNESEYETLEDLIADLQARPGQVSAPQVTGWPSSAIAQTVFLSEADAQALEVPGFGGGGDRISAILGNHIDFAFMNLNEAQPLYEAGQARVLAVAAPERVEAMPDVPTFEELGYAVNTGVWRSIAVPAGTPQEIRNILEAALEEAMASPELAADFEQVGLSIDYLDAEATQALVMEEYEGLRQVLIDAGVELAQND
ncbi:tripartite tricarboxylate transporter substrate binding protein [Arsenicitalea aurantiaca]|uniref:Tripartite tricarboxylate transporter substrate binding protein n=1 Tax=Arsenicitalea aurantiaca TaxID=1783274 RepID=A0A433X7R9_9HYPH|nr:tripartite tricarboxylate transporter substrate binding protein [Arsenicitalea aurantiaca]RUT30088.1 tripartite tricarboxylate transporter substrate binding protein [Arsenicitalea aurantiaca]